MAEDKTGPLQELVHDGFMNWSHNEPSRTAIYFGESALSYGDLYQLSARFAAEVDRCQAKRVGICLPNGPAVIEVFFGTLIAGSCVCLFDPTWPIRLIQDLINDHAPDMFVAQSDVLAQLSLEGGTTSPLSIDDLNIVFQDNQDVRAARLPLSPDTPFLIGFTSGTSAKPKAFIRSHATWVESFRHSAVELRTKSDDVVVAPGPLSHGLSLYAAIEAISAGGMVILHSHYDATEVIGFLEEKGATMLVVVPSMLDPLVCKTRGQEDKQRFPHLSRIVTAGSKLTPSLRRNLNALFPNTEIIEYYGASELSFITIAKGSETCPPESVGRPFSGVQISVRDDVGAPVKLEQSGVIWVRSEMVSSGYVGPTDGSGFRTEGNWATVGDIGHFDEDGFLYLDGREGSIITSAGYTVYPSSIETVLMAHPKVNDAVVISLPHVRWGEVIAAAVVIAVGANVSEKELISYCLSHLEPYACPRRWRFVDRLDRTSSGKVRQVSLASLFD